MACRILLGLARFLGAPRQKACFWPLHLMFSLSLALILPLRLLLAGTGTGRTRAELGPDLEHVNLEGGGVEKGEGPGDEKGIDGPLHVLVLLLVLIHPVQLLQSLKRGGVGNAVVKPLWHRHLQHMQTVSKGKHMHAQAHGRARPTARCTAWRTAGRTAGRTAPPSTLPSTLHRPRTLLAAMLEVESAEDSSSRASVFLECNE